MSKTYYNYYYLGPGYIGFSFPGFTLQDDGVIAFVQSDPVVRVEISNANAAWLDVEIIGNPSPWGVSGFSVSQHIAVQDGQTVYIPLADVLKASIVRTFSGITATPTSPCSELALCFTLKDADLTTLEYNDVLTFAYDALGNTAVLTGDWRVPGIPSTIRLFPYRRCYMTFPCMQIMEPPYGVSFVQYGNNGSVTAYPIKIDGSSRVFRIYRQTSQYPTMFAYRSDSGSMPNLYTTRVEWCGCTSDKLLLLWWSPELGGWKSNAADIRGTTDGVTERKPMELAFSRVDGVAGTLSFSAVFPQLTLRDYMYYRDILLSDEVYVVEEDTVSFDGSTSEIRKAVTVSGSMPAWGLNDVKDFEFTIKYDYTSEL